MFKSPENSDKQNVMEKKQFAPESKRKIVWVINLYDQWSKYRMSQPKVSDEIIRCDMNMLEQFSKHDLAFALSHFVREVKKLDGSEYPPNTVREMVIMVQMHLHQNNVFRKLFDQVEFATLQNVVDNTM